MRRCRVTHPLLCQRRERGSVFIESAFVSIQFSNHLPVRLPPPPAPDLARQNCLVYDAHDYVGIQTKSPSLSFLGPYALRSRNRCQAEKEPLETSSTCSFSAPRNSAELTFLSALGGLPGSLRALGEHHSISACSSSGCLEPS